MCVCLRVGSGMNFLYVRACGQGDVCVCPTFVHSDLGQASSSSLPNSVGDGKGHTVGQ